MIASAWFLSILFGLITLIFLRKFIFASLNLKEAILFVFSAILTAISIGLIHSGSWTAFIS